VRGERKEERGERREDKGDFNKKATLHYGGLLFIF
jgi:hypothetical protein